MVAATAPVLTEIAHQQWQTTVLVTYGSGTPCLAGKIYAPDYSLETTPPAAAAAASSVAVDGTASVTSCQVTVTFDKLAPIPAAATLVLDEPGGSSFVVLTVSRNVTWIDYLGIPALSGAVMVILLLLFLRKIRVYNWAGHKLGKPFSSDFRKHHISASGAWTVNDSWATNIVTLVTVIGIVLTATTSANTIFPGVSLGQFSILNALFGGVAIAAPLVFSIMYAIWSGRHPGVTEDARLSPCITTLHESTTAERLEAIVPGGAIVTLAARHTPARLAAGTLTELPDGTVVTLPEGGAAALPLPPVTPVTAQALAQAVMPAGGPTRAHLGTATTEVRLDMPTDITPVADDLVMLPAELTASLPEGTAVMLPGGQKARLAHAQPGARLPAGGAATIPPDTKVISKGLRITLLGGQSTTLLAAAAGCQAGTVASVPDGAEVTLADGAEFTLSDIRPVTSGADICVRSGAVITVPWGATAIETEDLKAAQVEAGHAIQIPPGSHIAIRAGQIAVPGGPDVLMQSAGSLKISNDSAVLTIGGGDLTSDHDPHAGDVTMRFPVSVAVLGGARITVTGVADLTLPPKTRITAPYRKPFELSTERPHVRLPQGSNSLVGTMRMVIVAACFTIFGIGAQIGLVGTLAFDLSSASAFGRWAAVTLLAVLGFFTLGYSRTAIAALADPQPGSSMSATSGTSFTL